MSHFADDVMPAHWVQLRAAKADRFFIDSLTRFGDLYLIPADRRMDWHAFDVQQEEAAEVLPVPEYARPIGDLSHLEFSSPEEAL